MTKRIKFLLFIIIIPFIFLSCKSNCNKIEVTLEKYQVSEEYKDIVDLVFPIISCENSKVKEKINTYIQLNELDIIKGLEKNNIFERRFDEAKFTFPSIPEGLVNLNYQLLNNTQNNFSFSLNHLYEWATSSYWIEYYNFNPQNGDRYNLKDFFDSTNYHKMKELLYPHFKELFYNDNNQCKDIDTNYYLDVFLNEEFLFDDFYFTKDSLFFDIFNILGKHDKFCIEKTRFGIPILKIKHLLNEYGIAAMISGDNLYKYSYIGGVQFYKGKVDEKYDFYLLYSLNERKTYLNGKFITTNTGKVYDFEGSVTNNIFEFPINEIDDREEGSIKFKIKDNCLIGSKLDSLNRVEFSLKAKRL
ncbi:MAG: hypothetical protein H6Q16_1980 [Bacteroidetes bacterium]|nr:hypothetical protein [Bacteroidota bacterium]